MPGKRNSVFSKIPVRNPVPVPAVVPTLQPVARPNPPPPEAPLAPVPLPEKKPETAQPLAPVAPAPEAPAQVQPVARVAPLPVAHAQRTPEGLLSELRDCHAKGNRLGTVARMVLVAGGTDFPRRKAAMLAIEEGVGARGYVSEDDVRALEGLAAEVVAQLGWDPRTEGPPSRTPRPLPDALVGAGDGTPTPRELCAEIRKAHEGRELQAVAVYMNLLNSGPLFQVRQERLAQVRHALRSREHLTDDEATLLTRMADAMARELGWDPRTQQPPRPVTVPASESLLSAVLAGDSAELVARVQQAQGEGRAWTLDG